MCQPLDDPIKALGRGGTERDERSLMFWTEAVDRHRRASTQCTQRDKSTRIARTMSALDVKKVSIAGAARSESCILAVFHPTPSGSLDSEGGAERSFHPATAWGIAP